MQNARARFHLVFGSAATMAATMAAAATLYFFPPGHVAFYPSCPLHSLTGLNCPGCGILRATHQLLHGNFAAAFQLNPLFLIALPMLSLFFAGKIFQKTRGKKLFAFTPPQHAGWVLVGIILLYGVWRNLPDFPFGPP